jgi:hypothetical protein
MAMSRYIPLGNDVASAGRAQLPASADRLYFCGFWLVQHDAGLG